MSIAPTPGSKVRVSFEGTVENDPWGTKPNVGASVIVRSESGYVHDICYAGTDISNVEPDYWPPKPGEVWRASGKNWVAYSDITMATGKSVTCSTGTFLEKHPDATRVLSA